MKYQLQEIDVGSINNNAVVLAESGDVDEATAQIWWSEESKKLQPPAQGRERRVFTEVQPQFVKPENGDQRFGSAPVGQLQAQEAATSPVTGHGVKGPSIEEKSVNPNFGKPVEVDLGDGVDPPFADVMSIELQNFMDERKARFASELGVDPSAITLPKVGDPINLTGMRGISTPDEPKSTNEPG